VEKARKGKGRGATTIWPQVSESGGRAGEIPPFIRAKKKSKTRPSQLLLGVYRGKRTGTFLEGRKAADGPGRFEGLRVCQRGGGGGGDRGNPRGGPG